ncbi:7551_t:CDS:2, partial [Dentiscutata heterogama]
DLGSNCCLLKASLVGVAQDTLKEIDSENATFKLLINNYAGKNYSFIIKILFPCHNSQFKYLINSVCPNESKISSTGDSQSTSEMYRSVRSRLLSAHQNVVEKSHHVISAEVNKYSVDSGAVSSCSRHTRVEDAKNEDVYIKDINFDYGEFADNIDERESRNTKNSRRNTLSCGKGNKGKEKVIQPIVHNTRSRVKS